MCERVKIPDYQSLGSTIHTSFINIQCGWPVFGQKPYKSLQPKKPEIENAAAFISSEFLSYLIEPINIFNRQVKVLNALEDKNDNDFTILL